MFIEPVRNAVASVLCDAANFPTKVQPHVLGQDMSPLIDKVTESVVAARPVNATPSAEAIEAAARAIWRNAERDIAGRIDRESCDRVARRAIRAALPHLAQPADDEWWQSLVEAHCEVGHRVFIDDGDGGVYECPLCVRPARVAPSVEEVMDALGASEADWRRARERGDETSLLVWQARSIAARLATQPTVAQVREQAAREMRVTPVFEDTLPNDGEYEYTSDSDCDGSNKFYLRRRPRYEGSYFPWETTTQEAWQGAVDRYKREENDHG